MPIGTAFPLARLKGIVTTQTNDELLAYDTVDHQIHHLNGFVANVWRACDGSTSIDSMTASVASPDGSNVNRASVEAAIGKLAVAGLLESPASWQSATSSRRRFLKQAGVAGAVAVPMIVSVSAPAAAQGGSNPQCGERCGGTNGRCNSNNCNQCGPLKNNGQGFDACCCNNTSPDCVNGGFQCLSA